MTLEYIIGDMFAEIQTTKLTALEEQDEAKKEQAQ